MLKMREEDSSYQFDNVKPIELDVTKQSSIKQATEQVKAEYGRLNVLMCNAGVSGGSGETPEQVFAVNIDGVHDTIEAFLPLVPSNGQVVCVTSEVGAWAMHAMPPAEQQTLASPATLDWATTKALMADWLKAVKGEAHEHQWPTVNQHMATSTYPVSKAFITAYLRSFAAQHQQPKLVIVCPGYCATDLNHHSGHRTAAKGGESVSWPILHAGEAEHGQFYQDGITHPFIQQAPEWAEAAFRRWWRRYKRGRQPRNSKYVLSALKQGLVRAIGRCACSSWVVSLLECCGVVSGEALLIAGTFVLVACFWRV